MEITLCKFSSLGGFIIFVSPDCGRSEIVSNVIWYVNALILGKRENNMVIDFNGARDFDTLAHSDGTGEMKLPECEEKDVKEEL